MSALTWTVPPFTWTATAADILAKVALIERDFKKLLACNLK